MHPHLPLASLLAIALVSGAAHANPASTGNAATVKSAAVSPVNDGFPSAPNEDLGLAAAHLPKACGGGLLPSNPIDRATALNNCAHDLDLRAAAAKAANTLSKEEHPKSDAPPVPGDGAPPGASGLVAGANGLVSSLSGPAAHGAVAATTASWPTFLMGGCPGVVCTGTFLVDGRHVTIPTGQWAGDYYFKRLVGSGNNLAAELQHAGKTKIIRLH